MILLREIQEKDIDALERFAQIPGFINLPNDRELLRERITRARESFAQDSSYKEGKYIFIAEDTTTGRVLGTSMIAAQHGTEDSPHFYFEVASEEKYSSTINTGFIHGTLKLKYDTNGPSEIGGLVIDPEQRNNSEQRIGRQISFVRFLFLALNKSRFKKKIIAELLPPLNKKGQSPLWEAVGRRFTNMDYWEADQLCQKNKEFIFSLFPSGKIYTTFLPAEARNAIGKVGKDTEPVVHMLKKIGFAYKNQVDPFDGGPHLWANVDDLLPVKRMATGAYDPAVVLSEGEPQDEGLLTRTAAPAAGEFRAVSVRAARGKQGKIHLAQGQGPSVEQALGLTAGTSVAFMPYY